MTYTKPELSVLGNATELILFRPRVRRSRTAIRLDPSLRIAIWTTRQRAVGPVCPSISLPTALAVGRELFVSPGLDFTC